VGTGQTSVEFRTDRNDPQTMTSPETVTFATTDNDVPVAALPNCPDDAMKKVYESRSIGEFATAIKNVNSSSLLELRRRASEKYGKRPEQGERKVLKLLDLEIHSRQLWPWTAEVRAIVRTDEDHQKVFAGGLQCANSQCECRWFGHDGLVTGA